MLDRRDLKLLSVACLAVLIGLAGFIAAVEHAIPDDRVFSGCLFNNVDGWSYRAYANYYRHGGGLAIDNPWATEPKPPAFINLTWLLIGRLMAAGIPLRVSWHALQALGSCLLLTFLLALIRRLTPDRITAWTAFLLCAFGSGFGWLAALFDPTFSHDALLTVDFFQTDAFPVMMYWHMPHLPLSWAMLLAIYLFMHMALSGRGRRWSMVAAAIALPMGFIHPYSFVTILPVTAAWWLATLRRRGRAGLRHLVDIALLAGGMLPGLLYFGLVMPRAPNFIHVWQGFIQKPGLVPILLGYGLFVPLALVGLAAAWRKTGRPDERLETILVWLAVQGVLHIGPFFRFAAHLGEGLLVPMSILAAGGFLDIRRRLLERRAGSEHASPEPPRGGPIPWAWVVPLVLAVFPSTVYLVGFQVRELGQGRNSGLFGDTSASVPRKALEALDFLDRQAGGKYPLVLSGPHAGLYLPAFARIRSLNGHPACVKDSSDKFAMSSFLFGSTAEVADWLWLLETYPVEFVWWSRAEDRYGAQRPPDRPFMKRIFDNGEVTIYRVIRPE